MLVEDSVLNERIVKDSRTMETVLIVVIGAKREEIFHRGQFYPDKT